jgi:transposase-like protein
VLRDLRGRGIKLGRLTISDDYLVIWSALGEIHLEGDEQRCWNHRMVNVLDALLKSVRNEASFYFKKIPYVQTRGECENLRNEFIAR